jgi:hypothetical protein
VTPTHQCSHTIFPLSTVIAFCYHQSSHYLSIHRFSTNHCHILFATQINLSHTSHHISSRTFFTYFPPKTAKDNMVSTICHKSDNENFYARISDSILINELVEELTEFSLPINGYKHQLQARLQLAYLGVQASEHEEKIGSWFKLKLGQLQAECKDRKISDKGSKADLRRKLGMHLCAFPTPLPLFTCPC